ncbi:hypothetical protein [Motilimonas eburnea]|uniref:hypothetical protein n=1 Tax=Motilimonas eburnea TaxID=1737488 RepID=UPI001E44F9FF|nr:hypothetical protein [Motilimonas eburnea]MCE2571829.1 hypothetical protein [Motilimonas eburnea]
MNIAVTPQTLSEDHDIQIDVEGVLSVLQEVPVPGFAEVLAPLNAILALTAPDPFDEVNRKLDEANQKLDNMFGVIISALDKNDIQQAVINAKAEFKLLATAINQSVEDNQTLPANRARDYFENIFKCFESCLENSRSYITQFNKHHKEISEPLSERIGKYMYALEQCQEGYTVLIEAARNIQSFHTIYPALCDDDKDWHTLYAEINKNVTSCSEAYKTFIGDNAKHYPTNIAPIMANTPVTILQSNKSGRYLYWDTKDKKKAYSGDSHYGDTYSGSYYLLGWKKLDKAPTTDSYKFKFVNLSNPDNTDRPKWGIMIEDNGSTPCFMGATALQLCLNHGNHYYISTKQGGPVDDRARQWIVDINSDGTLTFGLSDISYMKKGNMRENWGHFTIEDKDSNNRFTVS